MPWPMPNTVGALIATSDLKDLGVHTEMYVDAFAVIAKEGKINGHNKTLDYGRQVFAFAAGSKDMVFFFSDPQSSDLDAELKYINQMCDQYNIPFATNVATAEMLIHGLERGDLDWREIVNPSLKPVTV